MDHITTYSINLPTIVLLMTDSPPKNANTLLTHRYSNAMTWSITKSA